MVFNIAKDLLTVFVSDTNNLKDDCLWLFEFDRETFIKLSWLLHDLRRRNMKSWFVRYCVEYFLKSGSVLV